MFTPPTGHRRRAGTKGTLMSPGRGAPATGTPARSIPRPSIYYAVSHTLRGADRRQPDRRHRRHDDGLSVDDCTDSPGRRRRPARSGTWPQWRAADHRSRRTAGSPRFNLNTGEQVWMAANGDGPRNHPLLKDLHLPPLGIPNRAAPLLTRTLLFLGEGSDAIDRHACRSTGAGARSSAPTTRRPARVLWETELPARHHRRADDLSGQRPAVHRRARSAARIIRPSWSPSRWRDDEDRRRRQHDSGHALRHFRGDSMSDTKRPRARHAAAASPGAIFSTASASRSPDRSRALVRQRGSVEQASAFAPERVARLLPAGAHQACAARMTAPGKSPHALRGREDWDDARDTEARLYDLVVVGGGISGLAAA